MRYLQILIVAMLFTLSVPASAGPVDINTADAAMLAAAIDGVGEKRAAIIVQHREINGPFASVDELADVKGIGAATVERNRQHLRAAPVAGRPHVAGQ
jgi:competence protein ComEA